VKKSDRLGRVEEDASPCSRRIPASDQREVLGVDVLASKRLKSDLTLAQNLSSMLSSLQIKFCCLALLLGPERCSRQLSSWISVKLGKSRYFYK